MSQIDLALRVRFEAAQRELTTAEQLLETVLGELRVGARAEKVTVSAAVEEAFARLRLAREVLSAVQAELMPIARGT